MSLRRAIDSIRSTSIAVIADPTLLVSSVILVAISWVLFSKLVSRHKVKTAHGPGQHHDRPFRSRTLLALDVIRTYSRHRNSIALTLHTGPEYLNGCELNADGLAKGPAWDVKEGTLHSLLEYVTKRHRNRPALGHRPLLKTSTEERVDKQPGQARLRLPVGADSQQRKPWTLYEKGPYIWRTYEDVAIEAEMVGRGLASLDCRKGSTIAIFMETCPEWLLTAFGAWSRGIVVATVYTSLGSQGLLQALNEAEVTTLVTSADLISGLLEMVPESSKLRQIISVGNPTKQDLAKLNGQGVQVLTYEECKSRARSEGAKIPENDRPKPDDVAVVMYTSGTTGKPKGVVISHGNLIAVLSLERLAERFLSSDDVFLAYLPLAHILELIVECLMLYLGMSIGFGSKRTLTDESMRNCKGDFKELRPTIITGVPEIWSRILKGAHAKLRSRNPLVQRAFWAAYYLKRWLMTPDCKNWLLDCVFFREFRAQFGGRLRFIVSGGAALSAEAHEFLQIAFSAPTMQGYGLTETGGMCSLLLPGENLHYSFVGSLVPCVMVKLRDIPEMHYFHTSDPPRGEILIRGPSVARGYLKMEEKTKEDFHNGWFATGDIGEWIDGQLRIIDRKKNHVKLASGEYIALEQLEEVYTKSDLVERVCVHADVEHNTLVAIVQPKNKGESESSVLRSLQESAKTGGLHGQEVVEHVILSPEDWTSENGLLTAAMKVKRQAVVEKHKEKLQALLSKVAK